jgi:hypothetical protein
MICPNDDLSLVSGGSLERGVTARLGSSNFDEPRSPPYKKLINSVSHPRKKKSQYLFFFIHDDDDAFSKNSSFE